MLKAWFTLLRLPDLFALPGEVITGLLLAGAGLPPDFLIPPGMVCLSAVCASVCGSIFRSLMQLKEDCLNHPERPIPSGKVSPRAAMLAMICAGLFAILPAYFAGWYALAVAVLLLTCSFRLALLPVTHVLRIALGVAAVYPTGLIRMPHLLPVGLVTLGMFLFSAGRLKILSVEPRTLMKPGRRIFISGAIIAYGTLFGIALNTPTDNWYSLLCGGISALSSGVFVVLTYWAFRLLQYPNTPADVLKCAGLLTFSQIFLHAGAAAILSSLKIALLLLAAAVLSRILARWISKQENGA